MKKILFILYTCCILLFPVSAQQIPSFKANDRIVFLGNSITEGGHYHSYIWLYYMTHFPELPLRIYNGGICGRGYGAKKRVEIILIKNYF